MTTKKKAVIGIGIALLVVLLGALWFMGTSKVEAPVENLPEEVATTTTQTNTPPPVVQRPDTLPPEPSFTLPAGATAIDDYAYILDGQVYFRSITSPNPLAIPNSDAQTFEKLSEFTTLPSTDVVADCGISPTYGFYGDKGSVYMYEIWRAPKFRSSTIQVIVGADKDTFEVPERTIALSDGQMLKVGYQKATTTCSLNLTKVSLERSE